MNNLPKDNLKQFSEFLSHADKLAFDQTNRMHHEAKTMSTLYTRECETAYMDSTGKYKGCPYTGINSNRNCGVVCGRQWRKWLAPFIATFQQDSVAAGNNDTVAIIFKEIRPDNNETVIARVDMDENSIDISTYRPVRENTNLPFDMYRNDMDSYVDSINNSLYNAIESSNYSLYVYFLAGAIRDTPFFRYLQKSMEVPNKYLLAIIPQRKDEDSEPDRSFLGDASSSSAAASSSSRHDRVINATAPVGYQRDHWDALHESRGPPPLKKSKNNTNPDYTGDAADIDE